MEMCDGTGGVLAFTAHIVADFLRWMSVMLHSKPILGPRLINYDVILF
jgi:hypothetical protein